jgi:hypothetical protein
VAHDDTWIYAAHFDFEREDADEDLGEERGTFEIIVEAANRHDALSRCRAKLNEIAESSEPLGPILVFLRALVEIPKGVLLRGVLVHSTTVTVDDERCTFEDALPAQEAKETNVYFDDDFPELVGEKPEGAEEGTTIAVPFWDGREGFNAKWKLYWCETEDHDEDWFVVARNAAEASDYYEGYEGYDEGDASAERVCVLPGSEQERTEPGWPSRETLEACGAEVLVSTPQDGANGLRAQVGSGSQVVRLKGRVFAEGDIVGNTLRRLNDTTTS